MFPPYNQDMVSIDQQPCPDYKEEQPSRVSGVIRNVSLSDYVISSTRRGKKTQITQSVCWWQQPGLDGITHQSDARVDAEPGVDAVQVGRDGARADDQPLGDFGVGQVIGD